MNDFCMACYLEQFSEEKLQSKDFILERMNEFFPCEEFDGQVPICPQHAIVYHLLKMNKKND